MFDFEKLTVYSKAKAFNLEVSRFLKQVSFDNAVRNQLRRAAIEQEYTARARVYSI